MFFICFIKSTIASSFVSFSGKKVVNIELNALICNYLVDVRFFFVEFHEGSPRRIDL